LPSAQNLLQEVKQKIERIKKWSETIMPKRIIILKSF
jgi:hypothetical protein